MSVNDLRAHFAVTNSKCDRLRPGVATREVTLKGSRKLKFMEPIRVWYQVNTPGPQPQQFLCSLQKIDKFMLWNVSDGSWRGARAYNRGLGAEPTGPTPLPPPCKNSSDLYQFQERPPAKVGWTCPPQSTPWRRHCSDNSITVR